jgi:hypothetical protein
MDMDHPLLVMRVTDVNRHSHTDNIGRQLTLQRLRCLANTRAVILEAPEGGHRERGL